MNRSIFIIIITVSVRCSSRTTSPISRCRRSCSVDIFLRRIRSACNSASRSAMTSFAFSASCKREDVSPSTDPLDSFLPLAYLLLICGSRVPLRLLSSPLVSHSAPRYSYDSRRPGEQPFRPRAGVSRPATGSSWCPTERSRSEVPGGAPRSF